TGAAPIIAKIAKDMGLLTVAIVTTPFAFEGKTRNDQAQNGIKELREFVDSIIVINNNKLREVYGNLGFKSGFSKADEVLSTAAMGITNVITNHYTQNIDFRDANTVLANSGSAIMGSAKAEGVNRAQDAITKALDSPLLNDNKITGAKNVLLLIVSGINEITIDEIGEINDYIQSEAKTNVNIIMGVGEDVDLGDSIEVTIVATGFDKKQQSQISTIESKKIVYNLDDSSKVVKKETLVVPKKNTNNIDNIDKPVNKEPKIVHQLDKDLTTPLTLFDITDVESTSSKNIIDKDEVSKEKGFLGNDFLDLLSDVKNELTLVNEVTENKTEEKEFDESNLIPTSKTIKNIEVIYDEVMTSEFVNNTEDEFIITSAISDIEVIDMELIKSEEEKEQMTSLFDLPLNFNQKTEKNIEKEEEINEMRIKSDLDEIKQIEVVDTKIVSENKVYSLDDYMQLEDVLDNAKAEKKAIIVDDVEDLTPELKMETRIVADNTIEEEINAEISPLNGTINQLKKRADERRIKMKDYNYKFTNKAKQSIDELEKQPAYKRNNIELDDNPTSNNITRTSLEINGD
ncbi:MAG TPA: hypothetical protein EYG80_00115, partial [Flavobacteriaceae bacterium]|nr:hypothetical protein [Flavobacteriaceae bacterium]